MRPTQSSSVDKKKREKDRKAVKDDFYDRINYYESRNIFSSNEPFNPSNRLYTDQAALSHPVWSTIGRSHGKNISSIPIVNDTDDMNRSKDFTPANTEISQTLLSSINKMNTSSSSTPIGCKKCGYVGHLPFQCRNDIKLKSNVIKQNANNLFVRTNVIDTDVKNYMSSIQLKDDKGKYLN